MEMQRSKKRELTFQEKRAAMLWARGIDVDGEQVNTKKDIATRCGMSESQLRLLFTRQEFLDEVDKHLTAQKINSGRTLMQSVPKAVERLVKIIEFGEDREAALAAKTLLSIAGFSDHKTVDVNVNDAAGVLRGGFGKKMLQDADVIDVEASDIEEIEGDADADV